MNIPIIQHRYMIHYTYNCNLSCKWCDRHIDYLPWENSDVSIKDIRLSAEKLKEADIKLRWIKIAGGEPLVHPEFVKICDSVNKYWVGEKSIKCTIAVNDTLPLQKTNLISKYKKSKVKNKDHFPCMISPKDMGIEITNDDLYCRTTNTCGKLFDTFGFGSCPYSGVIGRIIQYDPYSEFPVLTKDKKICEHCIQSIPKKVKFKMIELAKKGKLEFPTKTYKEGIEKNKSEPFVFKKFQERVSS